MDHTDEPMHFVKRVVLPSGKTIEVVYFRETENEEARADHPAAEPHQELHMCIECSSGLVYPVRWDEAGPENWSVLLHCPDCDVYREGIFAQNTVEAFDEELDRGGDALAREYKRLLRANMEEELARFSRALAAEAILPEDF